MRMRRAPLGSFWAGAVLSVLWVARAEAYVDPGTGALLWQLLLATFVGLTFYLRRFIRSAAKRILGACRGRKGRDG